MKCACSWTVLVLLMSFTHVSGADELGTQQEVGLDDATVAALSGGQLAKQLEILVVSPSGSPVADATVTPWALRSSQGHGWWSDHGDDPARLPPQVAITNQDGMATVEYPFYRDADEQTRCIGVSVYVNHPEFAFPDAIHIDVPREDDGPYKVALETGVPVEILPTIDGKPAATENLFVLWSDGRSWQADSQPEKSDSGTLIVPAMRPGANSILVAQVENDQATYFSTITDFELSQGERKRFEIPLTKTTPIEGKLSDSVPRPVREGRVVLWTLDPSGASQDRVGWYTWVAVRDDGRFTIQGWPPGEAIQAIALCDGFIGKSGNAPKEVASPPDPDTDFFNRPQVFRAGEYVEIEMLPMVDWVVTTVDEDDEPVAGIEVASWPNVGWWNSGSQIYAGRLARSEVLVRKRDYQESIDDAHANPFHGTTDGNGKATIQLPTGKESLTVISDVYELPVFLGRRTIAIESQPDRTNEVTLRLQPRGTDRLGEWDKLAGVVFGCSTREGRRICALPEVREKMEAFTKRFREAKNQQDPQLLSEAYTMVAEAFAGVGDLEESTKWYRKAAEQTK